jgi:predicted RecB family nuclease
MTTTLTASAAPVLLGSYAARSCPVKTHHTFDPTATLPPTADLDPSGAAFANERVRFEDDVLRLLLGSNRAVADLRDGCQADCRAALESGVDVIIGGRLPVDPVGHRVGRPAVLLRDRTSSRPIYHPVLIKWHKVLEPMRQPRADEPQPPPGAPLPTGVPYSSLSAPHRESAIDLEGYVFRRSREADLLQLAHYHRMLEAAGFADGQAWTAIVSKDDLFAEPVLFWLDLTRPSGRLSDPDAPQGWRLANALERYDGEHTLRMAVAEVALRQTGRPEDPEPLVHPVVTVECRRCPWWDRCRPQLDPDDISLRIDKGALDRREVGALRQRGITTIADLAQADLDDLLVDYLPSVAHRSGPESRLRVAARRATMLLDEVPVTRETSGPIELPRLGVEIDFDIESSADGRIYLWGFAVSRSGRPAVYREFSCFYDLDQRAESVLAREALGWLRSMVEPGDAVVYHYSGYEVARIRELAERETDPMLSWAARYAEDQFVDLFETVRTHYFGASGLGLKQIAQYAGFRWRDEDPGGLNSQRWFAEAVHCADPALRDQARRRVLQYNEDDVLATRHLRQWLRTQT